MPERKTIHDNREKTVRSSFHLEDVKQKQEKRLFIQSIRMSVKRYRKSCKEKRYVHMSLYVCVFFVFMLENILQFILITFYFQGFFA